MAKRPSSIDKLPPAFRDTLNDLLRDPRVSQIEAAEQLNAMLADNDLPERVSKSAVNRYAMRMEEVGAKLRQSREIADMWVGKLGNEPQGKVGKLLNEMIRTMAFDAALSMQDGDEPPDPKLLKELSLSIKHLEDAASVNEKREREIRKQAAESAAETADQALRRQGMSRDTIQSIKQQILGIAS